MRLPRKRVIVGQHVDSHLPLLVVGRAEVTRSGEVRMLLVDALTALFVKKTERHNPFTALPVDTHTHILIRLVLHMLEMPV